MVTLDMVWPKYFVVLRRVAYSGSILVIDWTAVLVRHLTACGYVRSLGTVKKVQQSISIGRLLRASDRQLRLMHEKAAGMLIHLVFVAGDRIVPRRCCLRRSKGSWLRPNVNKARKVKSR